MNELQQATKALEQARKRHVEAQEEQFKREVAPKLAAMVGTYLVYRRNCYSCPEKPSDYWDIYARVDKVDGASLILTTAEVDSYGKPILTQSSTVSWDGSIPSPWEQTTPKLFGREVRRALTLLGIAPLDMRP